MASDSAFFGDSTKVLETVVEPAKYSRQCSVESFYEIARTVEWLTRNENVKRVALQFPDEFLSDSSAVVECLQEALPNLVFFVLADTSYGSCCVDSVAAQHYNADALVHYGSSCLSLYSGLPVLWVFGRAPIDTSDCSNKLKQLMESEICAEKNVVLMYSVEYNYVKVTDAPDQLINGKHASVNGRLWQLQEDTTAKDYDIIYIGGESRTLTNLMMTLNSNRFYTYNPLNNTSRVETVKVNKHLMKRYYLIEKAKDAQIIGIVVGTMGVANYLDIHERLKELIKKCGKKSYSVVVGKLNPAKLGNFMEIDIFVLVSCCESSLIDSSDFYKPVITPYELEIACNTERTWTGEYVTDFASLLPGGAMYQPLPDTIDCTTDVSLVSSSMRKLGIDADSPEISKQVALRDGERSLVQTTAHSAGEYLTSRSWTGLQQDLGLTAVEKAKQGQTGIAMGYSNEGS